MTRFWLRSSSALLVLLFAASAQAEIVDRIVAVVNDEIILLSELARNSAPYEERAAQEAGDAIGRALARKEVRKKVLDQMVADKLVEDQAKDLGIRVEDREIEQEIARLKRENGLDEAEFAKQMRAQGFTEESLRDYLRKSKLRQKVLEVRVQPRVVVSEAEVRAYYDDNFKNDDEVHVRMISKRIPQAASGAEVKAVREMIEKLRAEVTTGGKDFVAVAKRESEGPNPAAGGDLGWFRRGEVAPEIEQAAFGLQQGEVSKPIELGGAFHILQVVERRAAPAKPFDEVKDKIRAALFNRAGEKEYERWIADLRTRSFVDVRLEGPVPAEEPAAATPKPTATPK